MRLLALLGVLAACRGEAATPRDERAPAPAPAAVSSRPAPHASAHHDPDAPAASTSPAADEPPARSWPSPGWLCDGAVESIARNRGGLSLTFRLRIAGGGRAAFKPDQAAGFSRYRAELAAYRLSEVLGYGRVPPSCERSVSAGQLAGASGVDAAFSARLGRELRASAGGVVRGAAILWVDGIRPLEIRPARIRGHALETALSDMVWFDELCGNWDRWSGGNVFTDAAGAELVLIDNAAGFGPIGRERRAKMDAVLDAAGAPSPGLRGALAHLSRDEVAGALAAAGYTEPRVTDDVIARRDRMLSRRPGRAGAAGPR